MRRISTSRYACTTMALALAALVLSLPGCGAIDIDGILGENTCLILNCDGILFTGETEDDHDAMDDMGNEDDEGDGHDDMEGMGDEGDEEDGHDDMGDEGDEGDGHDEEDGAARSRSGTGTATGSS